MKTIFTISLIFLSIIGFSYPRAFIDWVYVTPDTIGFEYITKVIPDEHFRCTFGRDREEKVSVYHIAKNHKHWYCPDSLWSYHISKSTHQQGMTGILMKVEPYLYYRPILKPRSIDDHNYKKWLKLQ